jgi:hypothetical protein
MVWLTDRAPAVQPARASVVAAGGAAVPGPIGARGADLVVWDGGATRVEPGAAGARRVRTVDVPEPLERFVLAWAGARGVEVVTAPPEELVVSGAAPGADDARARVGAHGWEAEVRFRSGGVSAEAGESVRLASGGLALVAAAPGRVRTALTAMEEPAGDPAAFALWWGPLLDGALAPPAGVVPLAERLDAGAPSTHVGAPPERAAAAAGGGRAATWLALAGALLGLWAALGAQSAASGSTRP